jgi:hypothetical protein
MLGEEDLEGTETAEATIQSGSGHCFISSRENVCKQFERGGLGDAFFERRL